MYAKEIEEIDRTNFKNQYDLILCRHIQKGDLLILIKGDDSNYPRKFTHMMTRPELLNDIGEIFCEINSPSGGCQLCNRHDEDLSKVVDFVIYRDKKIPAIKHLGVCTTCTEAIEQAVRLTIENEFSEKFTQEYI